MTGKCKKILVSENIAFKKELVPKPDLKTSTLTTASEYFEHVRPEFKPFKGTKGDQPLPDVYP